MAIPKNKKETLLDRLRNAITKKMIGKEQQKSVEWLRAQLQNFAGYSRKERPEEILKRNGLQKTSIESMSQKTLVGRMFMYKYYALHKDTLPWWDAFPIGILVGEAQKGFYLMNMHYLPAQLRAKFFDALLDVMNTPNLTSDSRFIITYDILKNASKFKYFKPCFKHYLTSQVRSKIMMIPPEDWGKILFLNNASWQKATSAQVYKWSRDIIDN